VGDTFASDYLERLGEHVAVPEERGLEAAYALGRRALAERMAVLDLVAAHQDALHKIGEGGIPHSEHADAFLREALGAFEIARSGWWEAQHEARATSERVALLHDLNEAYLAVLAASTLDERIEEVTRRVVRLVGAERAEVVLEPANQISAPEGVLAIELPGGVGQIHVWPRRHGDLGPEEEAVAELALLVGGPLRDARLMQFAGRLAELGPILAEANAAHSVVTAFFDHGVTATGAEHGAVILRDVETLREAGIRAGRWSSPGGTAIGDSSLLAEVAAGASASFTGVTAVVPVNGNIERLGAVGLVFESPQPFDIVQRNFLMAVGDRVGIALERSVLFARERAARVDAQAAAERFRSLQQFAGELSRTITRRHIADLLLRRLQLSQGASAGFVAAPEADQRHVEVLARLGAAPVPERWPVSVPLAEEIEGDEPLVLRGADEIARRLPSSIVELPGVESIVIHRMGFRDVIGVVVLGWTTPEGPAPASVDAAGADVALAAAALRRAGHFDVEHDIAQTLQRTLLTIPATDIAGLRWAVRYQAGSAALAGGDWYDVIELDDDCVLLVIGDVVGKGVQAAAAVSQLRSACRALARHADNPLQLMLDLDEFALAVDDGVYSSLGLLRLDVATGRLQQVLAGHPPPVLVRPGGDVELLPSARGGLLGMTTPRSYDEVDVPPGSLLVLYTDGLVERRGELLDVGFGRLTGLLARATPPFDPQWICDWLIGELVTDARAADDVAILAVARDAR
jgi:hypothetical protein